MAAEGDVIITYIFTGEEERDENDYHIIPQNATHLLCHESVKSIPAWTFFKHPNIIEVYCHVGVESIDESAFQNCPRLKRIIIPGVKIVGKKAFLCCTAVKYVECTSLEIIHEGAFAKCESLGSIDLPSTQLVERGAFMECKAMTEVKFGGALQRRSTYFGGWSSPIESSVFVDCTSLERITIPLINGLFTYEHIFQGCENLRCVDLVESEVLQETADALIEEEWRNDLNDEINSITRVLLNTPAGYLDDDGDDYDDDDGDGISEKGAVIQQWITNILNKVYTYKFWHRLTITQIASILHLHLSNDIVMTNVLPFLELPSYTFDEGELL